MKYVERVLQPGETVIYLTTVHWLIYVRGIVLLAVAAIPLIAAGATASPGLALALDIVAALAAGFGAVLLLLAFIRRATTELAVTDRRVIYKTGLFQRHTMEMNRSKVETVAVDQSILGRLLGYGTVTVRGTGGSFEPIGLIGDPLNFRSRITAC